MDPYQPGFGFHIEKVVFWSGPPRGSYSFFVKSVMTVGDEDITIMVPWLGLKSYQSQSRNFTDLVWWFKRNITVQQRKSWYVPCHWIAHIPNFRPSGLTSHFGLHTHRHICTWPFPREQCRVWYLAISAGTMSCLVSSA
jgi:hypothetical protein